MSALVSAAATRTVPGISTVMAIMALLAMITRSATMGLGAPCVNGAAVTVTAYSHADFIHRGAAGTAVVRDPP